MSQIKTRIQSSTLLHQLVGSGSELPVAELPTGVQLQDRTANKTGGIAVLINLLQILRKAYLHNGAEPIHSSVDLL